MRLTLFTTIQIHNLILRLPIQMLTTTLILTQLAAYMRITL